MLTVALLLMFSSAKSAPDPVKMMVTPAVAVPDNCHTVLITNHSATLVGVVARGTAGGALVPGTSGQRIPPSTTLTLALGTRAVRGILDQAAQAGSGLIFDAVGGALTLEVTYLNQIGAP